MSTLLGLSNQDLVPNATSIFEFKLLTNIVFNKHVVALTNSTVYRSWNNIDEKQYNNNKYSFVWPTSLGDVKYSIAMEPGIYTIADINVYLQTFMFTNKLYLLDTNQIPVYYLAWETNPTYYSVGLIADLVPSVLGTLTMPPGATWALPPVAIAPQVTIDAGS